MAQLNHFFSQQPSQFAPSTSALPSKIVDLHWLIPHNCNIIRGTIRSNLFRTHTFHTLKVTQPAFIFSKLTMKALEQGEICSKLTIKTLYSHNWRRSSVFIVNFEHISHHVLVFLFLIWTCNFRLGTCFYCQHVLFSTFG